MDLQDPHNQLKCYHGPGIWEDMAGAMHLSIPEFLNSIGWEDTPEHHEMAKQVFTQMMKQHVPNTEIRFRKSPTDDGEDLR